MELVKGDPDFVKAFYRFCDERANYMVMFSRDRCVWRIVGLGTHKSHEELRLSLLDGGCKIGVWGGDILKEVQVASEPIEVELVAVTVAELGFSDGAKRSEIYSKAQSLGLELCPAEVGPQLRLQYLGQPPNQWLLLIAMEPIVDSDVAPRVFYLGHDSGGRWLDACYGHPDAFWHGGYRWVFCRK